MHLSQAFETYLPLIEAEIRAVLEPAATPARGHYDIMQYHMGWRDAQLRPVQARGGKRIRPMLCVLAAAATGADPRCALPAAAGLELLHNFSLLHDDIEDGSPTRRHRPTAWVLFGMPIACNAGDGMFSLAHLAFFRLAEQGTPADRLLAALRRFDETCLALTEGQFLDMSFEARLDVTVADYFTMIAGKTGALLAAAPELGALIAGAMPDAVAAYHEYGAQLGRAFQLQDDILGIWGDETVTGKSAAGDILSKKKTLPVLHALNHPAVGPRLAALYAGPAFTSADAPAVLALLEEAAARRVAEEHVRRATAAAHAALARARPSAEPVAHALLAELLDSLVGRQS
ncbi:MAG: (2E,6E)-farnesyl diphosphate synthase [Chloroflexi bacterium ADurb.Bin325]|nr:MAG: (2E,6E)-farnesyl diphosphate synthase [Chloroflexi bacterium ADurb.Bin325]